MSEQPEYLTTEEAADVLRVSQKTVLRWINSGRLRACKPGRGYRIRVEDLPSPDHDGENAQAIYLDDNVSNPLDPIVRDAVVEALRDPPANACSTHANGSAAHYRIDIARERRRTGGFHTIGCRVHRWSDRSEQPVLGAGSRGAIAARFYLGNRAFLNHETGQSARRARTC